MEGDIASGVGPADLEVEINHASNRLTGERQHSNVSVKTTDNIREWFDAGDTLLLGWASY